jgi:hypothetical protein
VLGVVYALCVAVLAGAGLLGLAIERPYEYFTHDPIQAIQVVGPCVGPECILAGTLSNIGVILWIATGAVLLFTASLLARFSRPLGRSPYLWFGMFTLLLGIDDMFVIHEYAREWGGAVGLGELRLITLYGLAFLLLVVAFRSFVAQTTFWLLPVAGAFFASSVFFDFVFHDWDLLEDGPKLFGIGTWAVFFVGTALADARHVLARGTGSDDRQRTGEIAAA